MTEQSNTTATLDERVAEVIAKAESEKVPESTTPRFTVDSKAWFGIVVEIAAYDNHGWGASRTSVEVKCISYLGKPVTKGRLFGRTFRTKASKLVPFTGTLPEDKWTTADEPADPTPSMVDEQIAGIASMIRTNLPAALHLTTVEA